MVEAPDDKHGQPIPHGYAMLYCQKSSCLDMPSPLFLSARGAFVALRWGVIAELRHVPLTASSGVHGSMHSFRVAHQFRYIICLHGWA